jgi:hypothetical protein
MKEKRFTTYSIKQLNKSGGYSCCFDAFNCRGIELKPTYTQQDIDKLTHGFWAGFAPNLDHMLPCMFADLGQ